MEDFEEFQFGDDLTRIISLDASVHKNCGWTVFDFFPDLENNSLDFKAITGAFDIPKMPGYLDTDLGPYLLNVQVNLEGIFSNYYPDVVLIENIHCFSGKVSSWKSFCLGVILSACTKYEVPIIKTNIIKVKEIITNKKNSTLFQLEKEIRKISKKLGSDKIIFESPPTLTSLAMVLSFIFDREILERP